MKLDNEAARREARRTYLKGLHKGSYIQASLGMQAVAMRCDGRLLDVTPERDAAQVEAEKKAADYRWWLKSLGPW